MIASSCGTGIYRLSAGSGAHGNRHLRTSTSALNLDLAAKAVGR